MAKKFYIYNANTGVKELWTNQYFGKLTFDGIVYEWDNRPSYEERDLNMVLAKIEITRKTSWDNNQYTTDYMCEIYGMGEEFDPSYAYAYSDWSAQDAPDRSVEDGNLFYSGYEALTAGTKTVTFYYIDTEENIKYRKDVQVYVTNDNPAYNESTGYYQVKVDPNYSGQIAEVVDGYNMFTNIHQAIQFLDKFTFEDDYKLIYLCNGTYNERVDIHTKNTLMVGQSRTGVVISYGNVNGKYTDKDKYFLNYVNSSGSRVHTTDSSATFNVLESAENFQAYNFTIENSVGAGGTSGQALALACQADKVVFQEVTFDGYQDTMEIYVGRSYFYKCLIKGNTDFIFGNAPTAYFDQCEIYSKGSSGFISCFKGIVNDATATKPDGTGDYDYYSEWNSIYRQCNFTAPSSATGVALGRPWRWHASNMVYNSTIGSHISTTAYTSQSSKARYVKMSGGGVTNEPTMDTVHYYESSNSGSGAISSTISGMTYLDDPSFFDDFSLVFAPQNGTLDYNGEFPVTTLEGNLEWQPHPYHAGEWNPNIPFPPTQCTISYQTDYGTAPSSKIKYVGDTFTSSDLPTLTYSGMTFNGWYYNGTKVEIGETITGNMTLVARWTTQVNYTISYSTAHGTAPSSRVVVSGTALTSDMLPTLTDSDYNFDAWYYNNGFTNKANVGDTVNSNITLYANWTAKPIAATYYLNMNTFSGTWATGSDATITTSDGFTFTALNGSSTNVTNEKSRNIIDNQTINKIYKTGGKGTFDTRGWKFTLTGIATVTMYWCSNSSGSARAARLVYSDNSAEVSENTCNSVYVEDSASWTKTLSAGTYTFGGNTGIRLTLLKIEY